MTASNPLILVTGATGRLAGLVLPELASRKAKVRAFIRDQRNAAAVLARGAAEVAIGDLADTDSLAAALAGVDRLFYVPPAFMNDEAAVGCKVVDTARRMGVQRIVLSSAIHPMLTQLINHRAKALVEEHIVASDLEFTLLQPTLVYQNYEAALAIAARTGVFAEPYSNDSYITRVDYRDVACVAAIALCEDRLNYGSFELCAADHLNREAVAALMAQALQRPVTAQEISYAEWLAKSGMPADSALAIGLKAMFGWYDRHGLRGNATALRAILGREPRSLLSYFLELCERLPHDERR